jgi:flagellar assembly protein FliH
MMTSPCENGELDANLYRDVGRIPEGLLTDGGRGVSRLEFHSLDRPLPAVADVHSDGREEILKGEVLALQEQLRSQAERTAAVIDEARTESRKEARRDWEEELAARIENERSVVLERCEEFRQERKRYFARVESEVVRLALAIAARVLHREAQLDPLLLSGVVRVALDKLTEESTVVLRVPADEVEDWRKIFAREPRSWVQLLGDVKLQPGECVIDASVGSVELGVSAQLEEIERGFFDLLQQRPKE